MKIMHLFMYILIPFAVIFCYTGCSPVIPNPDPTPMPTRIPSPTPFITGLNEVGTIPTGDAAVIVSQGNFLYYTGWYGNTGNLGVINFSSPLYPEIRDTETIGYGQGIAVNGDYLYVQMDAGNEWELGCVAAFNISNPDNIEYLDMEAQGYYTGLPIFYRNGYLYNCSFSALSIYDVTNPEDIVYVTEIPTVKCYFAAFQDDFIYISEETKMTIYDISTPSLPIFMGEVVNSTSINVGIAVSGDYAYVGYYIDETISIIDVSVPTNPVHEKDIALSNTVLDGICEMKIHGHYLLGVAEYGFFVLDISDPLNPVEVAIITTITNYGWGFAINGKYAIVADDTLYHVIELLSY